MSSRIRIALAAAAIANCSKGAAREDGVVMLPGAPPVPRALAAQIEKAARAGEGEAPAHTNRLVLEPSPYLEQHAHNPVDWRPWGEEAFAEARRLGRPILVSIGYSTCHWCHVMAEESFEDVEIATYMNRHYIAIKVDREERPDVDATYLKALEVMGLPGGWPMNVWLTPDGKPFFGATYLPPRDGDRGIKSGFLTALRRGHELVKKGGDALAKDADRVAAAMRELVERAPPGGGLGAADLRRARELYGQAFDPENGGVALPGARNKFPADLPVRLLLRYARRTGDSDARRMAEVTLERMAAGGIRDHIGGGFHRYSTDPRWRIPHFEKMLYDNALLAIAYLEAYQATGREDFAEVAREIFEFVEREMRVDGGYAAALDADSAGADGKMGEGLFYTWTPDEVDAALNAGESARLVRAYYGVSQAGNFEGRSVLAVTRPLGDVAAALEIDNGRAEKILADARPRLLAARNRRPRPHRDDKVMTGWNGLMASALVRAALVLDRDLGYEGYQGTASSKYLTWAINIAGPGPVSDDDLLPSRIRRRAATVPGVLEDHAFVIASLLDVYEVTGSESYVSWAIRLDDALAREFEDPAGGFYSTLAGGDPRLLREKPFEDGAVPSGNSVMALNLLRLAVLTGKDEYRARADRLFAAASGTVSAEPAASSDLLMALDWQTDVPLEIVLVVPTSRKELDPFVEVLARNFVPNRVLVTGTEEELARQAASVPMVEGKRALGGRATAYVCLKGICKLPARDPAVFEKQIRAAQPLP